jgi:outer membrane protein OmpA-like peptidoglycan-associated protein
MNSKALVFILFAAWSAICWRWYVCGVKNACGDKREIPAATVDSSPAIEPETPTATRQTPIQPADNKPVEKKPTTFPAAEPDIEKVQLQELKDRVVINFPYSSTRREDNAAIDDYLSRLADYLKTSGGSVTITGHTDFVGDSKTNYSYGLRRAYGIRDILVKKGANKSRIKCASSGEGKPVATNDTALGRYKNRRVEIRVNQ